VNGVKLSGSQVGGWGGPKDVLSACGSHLPGTWGGGAPQSWEGDLADRQSDSEQSQWKKKVKPPDRKKGEGLVDTTQN